MWYEITWSDGLVSSGDTENAPAFIPFFSPVPGEGIPGVELEYIGMDSNFVHKDRLAEANQLLVECEEDLSEARDVVDELWACLEDSEAELHEVRAELEMTRQALAEVASDAFELLLVTMKNHSNPEFQLLQMLTPAMREPYLQKD